MPEEPANRRRSGRGVDPAGRVLGWGVPIGGRPHPVVLNREAARAG